MHRHPTEPHTYFWVERYRDAEALEAHSQAPYIAEAMANLQMWLAAPPDIQRYEQLAP